MITIESADNGWEISWYDDDVRHKMVFEPDDMKEFGYVFAWQRLLYAITDQMGMSGSKHDKYRIRILTGDDE